MRVVGGEYRGKMLKMPESELVRPTADMVKQAMFTKLQFEMAGKQFLDLFGGSGQMAIEAISRGAYAVVVDKNPESIRVIKQNCTGLKSQPKVMFCDFKVALKKLEGTAFDYIFADPPYSEKEIYSEVFDLVYALKLLSETGLLIFEHKVEFSPSSEKFELIQSKKYGSKALSYFKIKK